MWSVDRKGTFACSLFPVVLMITPNTSHDFGEVYKTGFMLSLFVCCEILNGFQRLSLFLVENKCFRSYLLSNILSL